MADLLILGNYVKRLPGYNIYVRAKQFIKVGSDDYYSYIINVYRSSPQKGFEPTTAGLSAHLANEGLLDADSAEAGDKGLFGFLDIFDNPLMSGAFWLLALAALGVGGVRLRRRFC